MPENAIYFVRYCQSRTVFKYEEPKPMVKTVYRSKKVTFRRSPQRQSVEKVRSVSPWKSFESFQERKGPNNPRRVLKKRNDQTIKAQREREHDKAVKCRPRVMITSDNTLDNYDRPFRHKFLEQMYGSPRVTNQGKVYIGEPLTEIYSPHQVKIEPLLDPYVCSDWCSDVEDWPKRQMRNTFNGEVWLPRGSSTPTPVHKVTLVTKRRTIKRR